MTFGSTGSSTGADTHGEAITSNKPLFLSSQVLDEHEAQKPPISHSTPVIRASRRSKSAAQYRRQISKRNSLNMCVCCGPDLVYLLMLGCGATFQV